MTYPSTPTRFTQSLPSDTNHNVDLTPAGNIIAGGLILLFFNSATATTTTPAGYTALSPSGGYNNGGARRVYVFAKISAVSDTGALVNCVTNIAVSASANVYYFPDEGYVLASCVAVSTGATGTSTTPNPDSLTSGFGAVDTLWIAGKNSGQIVSSAPASYANMQTQAGYGMSTAERQANGASENPGTFTDPGSSDWVAFTIAVRVPVVPTITSVTPDEVYDAQTGIVIAGTNFEAAQGTGGVQLADGPDYDTATKIAQTETAWGATSITITATKSTLSYGVVYVFVTSNAGFISAGFPVTLIEAEPALLTASAPAAEMHIVLYDSGGAQLAGVVDFLEASITEGINRIDVATVKIPYTAGGVSSATAMREIGIYRAGEGEIFRGFIVRVGTPVDENGVTVVSLACMSLALELQRQQTWRSILLLAAAAQDGLDDLLSGSGWTGTVTGGGYQARTKEFINQSLITAIGEFAETHSAYWRETAVGDRDVEVKNYHSPSGIVLTDFENASVGGQYGVLTSIDKYEEDAASVVNRVSFELKADGGRLVTPQESSRSAPYAIQSALQRIARVVSATIALVNTHKVSAAFEMIGENRYAVALYIGPTGASDSSIATIGGHHLDNLEVTVNNVGLWGGIAPPKGQPVVDFEDEAVAVTAAGVVGVENVDQFDPVYAVASNSGSSTTPSVSVSSTTETLVIAWLVLRTIGTPTVSATASQTLIDNLRNGVSFDEDQLSAWEKPGSASSTSITWTISPSQAWEAFAVALNPAKLYYVEDAASQTAYGLSEEMLQLGTFNELDTSREAIANAAYDAMVYFLRKRKAPPRTFGAKAIYLPGTPLDWRPGDTLRFMPYTTAVVEDERLICVERTHHYDADGVRDWSLTLSDTPQIPFDELTLLAQLLGNQRAVQANQV